MADGYVSSIQLPNDNTYNIKDKNAITEIQIDGETQTKTNGVVNLPKDTKVTQGNTTTNNWRHIILGQNSWSATEPSTDNVTAQVYRNNNLKISPGYGRLFLKGDSPQQYMIDTTFDLTASDNGVSSETWRALRFLDKNENNISLFISSVSTSKTMTLLRTYNKNIGGTESYNAYLGVSVSNTGVTTYQISDSTAFKTALSLNNVTNDKQVKGLSSGTTSGHVVNWGSDGYTIVDSGLTIEKSVPSDAVFTDTHRPIKLKGTPILGNDTTALNFAEGSNISLSNSNGTITIGVTGLPDPMVFKGSLGTGGTITNLPTNGTANIGDTYKVITDGTYAGTAAEVGDTFICLTKTSNSNTWELIPSGDEPSGTVTSITLKATSPISINSSSAITTSGIRTISHANSGVTAGTYRSVTVNATGHVTSGTNPTTISGYGITDAKINNGVITLGSNTITPLTSHQTVTDNNPTLSWGTKSKVATIGSTEINVTMPSNPNTDKNVLQQNSVSNNYRPIALIAEEYSSMSNYHTTNTTDKIFKSANAFLRASDGVFYGGAFVAANPVSSGSTPTATKRVYLNSNGIYANNYLDGYSVTAYERQIIQAYAGKCKDANGLLLRIDSGGLTIIGGGESGNNLASLIADDQTVESPARLDINNSQGEADKETTALSGSSEHLVLSSDGSIYFVTGCTGSDIANRVGVCLNSNRTFYPMTNNSGKIGSSSYRWQYGYFGQVYGTGGSGKWKTARDNSSFINSTPPKTNSYAPVIDLKTTNGDWSIGSLGDDENLYFAYVADSIYSGSTNVVRKYNLQAPNTPDSNTYDILHSGNTSFTQTLSSGTKIGTITINGADTDLYCQTNTNTWRSIKVNGTEKLDTGTGTGALDFKDGANTTVTYDSGVKIDATDEKVKLTLLETDVEKSYYVPFKGASTSIVYGNSGFVYYTKDGTTTVNGYGVLRLGNSTASGTEGNRFGQLRIYSKSTSYCKLIQADITSSVTHTLPATSGTILNTGNYNSYSPTLTGVGASGDWGINITGNADTATTANKVKQTLSSASSTYPLLWSGSKTTTSTTTVNSSVYRNNDIYVNPGLGIIHANKFLSGILEIAPVLTSADSVTISEGIVSTTNLNTKYIYASSGNAISVGASLTFQATNNIQMADRIVLQVYTDTDLNKTVCAVGAQGLPLTLHGTAIYLKAAAYTNTGAAVTSDKRLKTNIEIVDNRYLNLIKNLEPKRFKLKNNPEQEYHTGFIAQDVQELLKKYNINEEEFAAFARPKGDDSEYALGYTEFIPLLLLYIKDLEKRIEILEKEQQ